MILIIQREEVEAESCGLEGKLVLEDVGKIIAYGNDIREKSFGKASSMISFSLQTEGKARKYAFKLLILSNL